MQRTDRRCLKALVLAGGKSRRMGRDKAAITIDGRTMLARTVELAGRVATEVLVGVRDTQANDTRDGFATLPDAGVGEGPLDGILAALRHDQNADWLVLACDMPLLDEATLQALSSAALRDTDSVAVAMANTAGDLPEPMCAIWRAPMRGFIDSAFVEKKFCARKCLIYAKAALVSPVTSNALLNMNSVRDVDIARQAGAALA